MMCAPSKRPEPRSVMSLTIPLVSSIAQPYATSP
ncbi:Uncharacterised protein [Mycobacterium tuberculosis]|uniref:Uncharacterized protein n=1 Tax=Mycobacterium tuberculosis TaxID=1773 RepID=A0A916P9F2_MYCTX|nr:Uncharacterised protein [Mycobacterium tuberculosis]COZ26381.1 Uncharacterised protein [Mycobacterium tuberculosis]CPA02389.1 Uncharacterised protein [Mycobacterium tuberculosis]